MPLNYQSGEEIKPGDRVLLHGEAGEVEFVADQGGDPDDWYVKEYGGGVMIVELEPRAFGRVFIVEPETDEDLIFVARRT